MNKIIAIAIIAIVAAVGVGAIALYGLSSDSGTTNTSDTSDTVDTNTSDTSDTVDTVDTSDTVDTVDTSDTVDTVDTSDKPVVVSSFYPIYQFTNEVGGTKIDSSLLIPPGAEPHDWEPTIRDVQRLQAADLVVINGIGFETWIEDLEDGEFEGTIVDTSVGITVMSGGQDDHGDEHGDEHGDDHDEEQKMITTKRDMRMTTMNTETNTAMTTMKKKMITTKRDMRMTTMNTETNTAMTTMKKKMTTTITVQVIHTFG